MKKIFLILSLFCTLNGYAQPEQNKIITPLKPGDKLPDLPMKQVLLNNKIISLNSSDYKNKLLIIDFWDTYCSNCIASFPKLDSLQNAYNEKIQIISATYQSEDIIRAFKNKNKLAKAFGLPIMVGDTLFKSYFPYRGVPHTVWINNGKVIAIVGNEYLNKDVIEKILNGEPINFPVKNDFITYDYKTQSILGNIQTSTKNIWTAITGYKKDAPTTGLSYSTTIDTINGIVKDVFMNKEIARLYITLLLKIERRNYTLKPDMIIVESSNPERYDMNYKKSNEFTQDWLERNAICYESVLPSKLNDKQRAIMMLKDLDNKLGLHGRMELRPHKVVVIKQLKNKKTTNENGTTQSNEKIKFKEFMSGLFYDTLTNSVFSNLPPVIDEYNQPEKELNLYSYHDFPSLKKMLNLNGLDIVEETRPISVFVLSEKL